MAQVNAHITQLDSNQVEEDEALTSNSKSAVQSLAGDVADESSELTKHELQNTWTLWYLENDRNKSWADLQNEMTSISTVEEFWAMQNNIKPPSELTLFSDYSLFKKGVRPMWEDDANKKGGRWLLTMHKNAKQELDKLWISVLLCLIGETFDYSDYVCGAVVNIRPKNNKISVWTSDADNDEAVLEIGHKLRERLELPRSNLQYQLFKDTMAKQGTIKPIYTL